MEQNTWNGLNVINEGINENRKTFEDLNNGVSERTTIQSQPRREVRPFPEDYDFVRYQDRIKQREELKEIKNAQLAKGIIALGLGFTIVLGGSCAGSVIADKFDHIFKGETTEHAVGTQYPSKEAYEAGLTTEQASAMNEQNQEADRVFNEIASGEKQELTESDLSAIQAYPENEYGEINVPEAENTAVNTFPQAKAM